MRIFIALTVIALSFGGSAVQAASSVGTSSGSAAGSVGAGSATGLSTPRTGVGATGQSFGALPGAPGSPEL